MLQFSRFCHPEKRLTWTVSQVSQFLVSAWIWNATQTTSPSFPKRILLSPEYDSNIPCKYSSFPLLPPSPFWITSIFADPIIFLYRVTKFGCYSSYNLWAMLKRKLAKKSINFDIISINIQQIAENSIMPFLLATCQGAQGIVVFRLFFYDLGSHYLWLAQGSGGSPAEVPVARIAQQSKSIEFRNMLSAYRGTRRIGAVHIVNWWQSNNCCNCHRITHAPHPLPSPLFTLPSSLSHPATCDIGFFFIKFVIPPQWLYLAICLINAIGPCSHALSLPLPLPLSLSLSPKCTGFTAAPTLELENLRRPQSVYFFFGFRIVNIWLVAAAGTLCFCWSKKLN